MTSDSKGFEKLYPRVLNYLKVEKKIKMKNMKYLFDLPMRVDIVTDDDDQRIDTILDVENQRQNLKELAEKYTSIRRKDYLEWRIRLEDEMTKAEEK